MSQLFSAAYRREPAARARAPIGDAADAAAADVAGSAPITAPADGTAGPGCRFPAARGEIEYAPGRLRAALRASASG